MISADEGNGKCKTLFNDCSASYGRYREKKERNEMENKSSGGDTREMLRNMEHVGSEGL